VDRIANALRKRGFPKTAKGSKISAAKAAGGKRCPFRTPRAVWLFGNTRSRSALSRYQTGFANPAGSWIAGRGGIGRRHGRKGLVVLLLCRGHRRGQGHARVERVNRGGCRGCGVRDAVVWWRRAVGGGRGIVVRALVGAGCLAGMRRRRRP